MLNMALLNYGLAFLRRRGYTEIQPPFFMRREVMAEAAELSDFSETLYKVRVGCYSLLLLMNCYCYLYIIVYC